jgi:hypothetical protein
MVSVKTVASAFDKIQQIEQALFANYQTEVAGGKAQVSLMNGVSGLALLYYELYNYSQDELYRQKALEIINQTLQQLQEYVGSFAYCNGLAGPAYLFNYLREKGFLGSSIDELLLDADHVLIAMMQRLLKQHNLDLLHGALGMGHYLLARLTLAPERAELIEACEAVVDGIAQQVEAGLAFNEFVPGYTDEDARYVNCGMAHGVVANLMFLVKYLPLTPQPERVRTALQDTQQLLRRYRSADDSTLSAYPSIVMIKEHGIETYYGIPLGWCYGDTTVSLGLYHAGRALGDDALVAEAQALAERATRRATPATALTYDAGFCHGTHLPQVAAIQWRRKLPLSLPSLDSPDPGPGPPCRRARRLPKICRRNLRGKARPARRRHRRGLGAARLPAARRTQRLGPIFSTQLAPAAFASLFLALF